MLLYQAEEHRGGGGGKMEAEEEGEGEEHHECISQTRTLSCNIKASKQTKKVGPDEDESDPGRGFVAVLFPVRNPPSSPSSAAPSPAL